MRYTKDLEARIAMFYNESEKKFFPFPQIEGWGFDTGLFIYKHEIEMADTIRKNFQIPDSFKLIVSDVSLVFNVDDFFNHLTS